MSVHRIASRYAKSLMDLGVEQKTLETIKGNMDTFNNAVENRDLYLMFKSPIINTTKKTAIVEELFGKTFDKTTMGFLNIILRKGREAYLPEIGKEFLAQYKKLKEVSAVTLTTAVPLKPEAVEKIKAELLKSSETGKNIEFTTEVNPDIIGGFVIQFKDKLYDASIAHKLELLKKEFSGNTYESKIINN